jgi:hypothetical protein
MIIFDIKKLLNIHMMCGGGGDGGGDGGGGNPGAFGGPGAGPGDAPSGAPGSADGGTGIGGAAYAGGTVADMSTNFAGIQADFEAINADIEANPDIEGTKAYQKTQVKAKTMNTIKNFFIKVFDVLIAMTPPGAIAEALSLSMTNKGLVANLADLAAKSMAANPSMSPAEATQAALNEAGLEEGALDPATITSIGTIANNMIGDTGNKLAQTANAVDNYDLSPEEVALLDQIQQNQIETFTNTINERAYDVTQKEISRLVDRGVLQGSVGENVLSNIQEEALKAIAQGTTEITTERMKNELALIESGREMQWKAGESAKDRYFNQVLAEMEQDAADKANKWGLFGNVAGGIISSGNNDDSWGWSDLF